MAKFIYKAISRNNKEVSGEIEAPSQKDAKNILMRKGLKDIKVSRAPISISFGTKVKVQEIARFTRQFSVMFSSGLPITQCLDILATQATNPMLKTALKQVYNDVQAGNTIADSLRKHPKIFSNLYCHMVAAGEIGGILDDVLRRLSEYLEAQDRLIRKVKGAMTYPIVISVVAVGAVVAMLRFVVPTFIALFGEVGSELPLPTQVVVGLSDFITSYFVFIIILVVGLVAAFKAYKKSPKGSKNIDRIILKLPVFGDLTIKSIVARFSRTLGTLLHSGVNIIDSLKVTGKTANNKIFEEAVDTVIMKISGGENLSDPLLEVKIFPPMVVQMINVGEKTGNLDGMLDKVADFYEEEVDMAVDALTSILEPIVIVIMGAIIGGILIAMYLPMFDLFSKI